MTPSPEPQRPFEPWAVNPICVALLLWGGGWTIAAGCAAVAVSEHATASSLVGLLVATGFAVFAIRYGKAGLIVRGSAALEPPDGPPEGFGRRVVGWLAAAFWSAIGVVWNFSIFGAIARLARDGHGFSVAFVSLWAAVGFIPLSVTMIGAQIVWRRIFRIGPGRHPANSP